jgi:hypothetical protein
MTVKPDIAPGLYGEHTEAKLPVRHSVEFGSQATGRIFDEQPPPVCFNSLYTSGLGDFP